MIAAVTLMSPCRRNSERCRFTHRETRRSRESRRTIRTKQRAVPLHASSAGLAFTARRQEQDETASGAASRIEKLYRVRGHVQIPGRNSERCRFKHRDLRMTRETSGRSRRNRERCRFTHREDPDDAQDTADAYDETANGVASRIEHDDRGRHVDAAMPTKQRAVPLHASRSSWG